MKYYFAPLHGVTGYIYRNAHRSFFGQVDKYFTPFITPTKNKVFTTKELNDILPEHNEGITVIPQLLTNNAEHFIYTANELIKFGYTELNLNLGCPSGTVVSKGKGSGFLAHQYELDKFLNQVFSEVKAKISIKTRIGRDTPDEFYDLIEIYNKYPLEELIIHPRTRQDFYKNEPNLDIFKDGLTLSKNPVCYNGNIYNADDYNELIKKFPDLSSVMLGRGLIANPALIEEINGEPIINRDLMREFHEKVFGDYRKVLPEDLSVLFKMKELWFYMSRMFQESDKYFKKIRRSERLSDYEIIVSKVFHELDMEEKLLYRF
ncbi:tRNA-dihydrouridine synthase family protein [Clostridium sp. SHJSY1]|uniref:tRNA dihydrouridine synthase n=1 Tax=Clostridium sp. SHJSY1 TaxID=2942483 RepID=UPI00287609C4|nr:tRNA-dihydrouridine synthase family protein [Clostridium sp. SHJSY1]MDS0524693.1 tRNA-dihydrouridine synthase family protein [Clostridium sp. SHJSY1]